jgi:hypothetical protein
MAFLAQACGLRLQLVSANGVYRAFTGVDPTANSRPIPLALSGALQLRSLGAGGCPPSVHCPGCFNRPRRVLRMGPQVLFGFLRQVNYSSSLVSQYPPPIVAGPKTENGPQKERISVIYCRLWLDP